MSNTEQKTDDIMTTITPYLTHMNSAVRSIIRDKIKRIIEDEPLPQSGKSPNTLKPHIDMGWMFEHIGT